MTEKPATEREKFNEELTGVKERAWTNNDIKERLAFYVEWYVLDDDGGGYNLVVQAGGSWGEGGGKGMAHGGGAS